MKCKYCWKETDGNFCNDVCRDKYRRIAARAERVNEGYLLILIMTVFAVTFTITIIYARLGIGLMLLIFGLIFLRYPFVTPETLMMMSLRSSIFLMYIISLTCIVIGSVMAIPILISYL